MRYRITNTHSGGNLGVYEADSKQEALDAMSRDAGYADQAEACEALGSYGDDLLVEEFTPCGCADVWGGDGGGPCEHEADDYPVRFVPEYLRSTAVAAGNCRGLWTAVEVSAQCWGTISDAIGRGDLEAEWYEALV